MGRGGLDEHDEAGGDQVLGMMGIRFQVFRLERMPEWGKDDGMTQVIQVVIYAKSRCPLFVFLY